MSSTAYSVRPHKGRPALCIDGQPAPAHAYAYSYCGSFRWPGAEEIHRKFIDHGCRTFVLCPRGGVDGDWGTTPFWTDDNVFPDDPLAVPGSAWQETLDQARFLLDRAPDTRFWVRCMSLPPKRWIEKFPDDLQLNAYGKRYPDPCLASDRYDDQVGRFMENLVRQCERQPWGDRVIGYLVYPVGEGTSLLTCEGFLFDQSPVMQQGFRAFLRRRYGTDAALQAAWGRPEVTLDDARVPHDAEYRERGRARFQALPEAGQALAFAARRLHWPDPRTTVAERDYCWYMRERTERNFRTLCCAVKRAAPHKLAGLDAFKQSMLGWPLPCMRHGDFETFNAAMHPLSGAFDLARLLDMPELDAVATPHQYSKRGMGFGYEGEGIGDSVVLHGKLMLMEEDQRTFCEHEGHKYDYLADAREARAGFWRNFASALTRGYLTYPMDVCRPSYFMDDGIQAILKRRREVQEAALGQEHRDAPAVVMLLADTDTLHEDFRIDYQNLAVLHQQMYGLVRCGAPTRTCLFDDLARDDFPEPHRLFLLPNLFLHTPERLALLREKLFRNGNVVIFGPATGITDGTRLSGESARALTGIPLELVHKEMPRWVSIDRFDHPVTAGLSRRIDYGDSYPYGPLLVPQPHPDVRRLGGIRWPSALSGAGLVIREFGRGAAGNGTPGPRGPGDYAVVFTAAVPLPPELLRAFAAYSGTHVYSDSDDDLVFADERILGIHSTRPGRRTFRLPRATAVWDLVANRRVREHTDTLTLCIDPPQTRLLYLGDDPASAGRTPPGRPGWR
jgi:hypothetical protein